MLRPERDAETVVLTAAEQKRFTTFSANCPPRILISLVVCGWKARKDICQQASPRSFDSAP
jgi:phage-related protein